MMIFDQRECTSCVPFVCQLIHIIPNYTNLSVTSSDLNVNFMIAFQN